jgi:hypothetical protein
MFYFYNHKIHVCSVNYLFMAQKTKRKEKIIIQKVFYGHRLTQINADGSPHPVEEEEVLRPPSSHRTVRRDSPYTALRWLCPIARSEINLLEKA